MPTRVTTLFNYGQLVQGSFRGIKFSNLEDGEKESGRKGITHEYPNSNKRFREDLGLLISRFTVPCWVSNLRNSNDREALEEALQKEGPGELIHTWYGSINVSVLNYTVVNEFGRAIFNISFEKTNNSILPIQTNKNKSFVDSVKNTLKSLQESKFGQGVKTVGKGIQAFKDEVAKVNEALGLIVNTANSIINTTSVLADLQNEIFDVLANVNSLVKTPATLSLRFTTIFNNMEVIGQTASNTFLSLTGLFGFGNDDIELDDTSNSNLTIKENNRITNNLIRVNALSIAYTTALDIDYENDEQLQDIRNSLENEYQDLFSDLDEDTLSNLKSLRANANAVFDELEQTVPKIFTENFLNPQTMHQIVFNYYGNFVNAGEFDLQFTKITNLNPQITNYQKVFGEVKLLTNE